MLKENTVITLHPEDMFRLHAILLHEDRDAALDFLATVIKKKADAASEILKAVKAEKADLVVITTHGLSHDQMEKKSPLFGSVAEKVIRTSPVPVHLVNPFGE